MSPRETERSRAGRTTSPTGSGADRWWGRAVVACASLAALAGTVAAFATAAGADGEQSGRTEAREAADAARLSAPVPAADTAAAVPSLAPPPARPTPGGRGPDGRAGAPSLGATVAVPAGWQVAPGQDLVPVVPDRFPTVLMLADRATVLLGRLDPAAGTGPDALADEARRLVGAFADGAMGRTPGERGRVTDVSDDAGTLDGRDAHTVVRRVTTSDGPGPLVRVTTVAAGRGAPGLVLLAVAAPGPQQAADGTAADRVVRSLASVPVPPARPPSAGGRAGAPPASVTRAPGPSAPGRPVSPPPARPTPTDR